MQQQGLLYIVYSEVCCEVKLLSFVHEFLELCSSVYIFRKLISVAQEISIQGICLTASLCIYVINQKCP